MRNGNWRKGLCLAVLLFTLGYIAAPVLLACLPDGAGGMMPTETPDAAVELPDGG